MGKETLEEVAERLYPFDLDSVGGTSVYFERQSFIKGVKWKQEQLEQELQYFRDKEKTDERTTKEIISGLYTEEEVKRILIESADFGIGNLELWFEKFKK